MTEFEIVELAFARADSRHGVRVDITMVGPSGRFDMDIRILIPGTTEFTSSRLIYFVDGRARLSFTPFARQPGAHDGLLFLRIGGQDLPPIQLGQPIG